MCKRKLILFMLFVVPSCLATDLLKQDVDITELKQEVNTPLEYAYLYISDDVKLFKVEAERRSTFLPVALKVLGDDDRSNILFDSNGPMSSGIIHEPGSSDIILNKAGIYEVNFSGETGVQPSFFALILNNQHVPGTGSGGRSVLAHTPFRNQSIIIMQAIITVNAGDILKVRVGRANNGAVLYGNASIIIKQVASK